MRRRHGWSLATLAALTLLAGGCNQPRALPAVQESGDRNVRKHEYEAAYNDYNEYLTRDPGEPNVQLKMAQTLLELNRSHSGVNLYRTMEAHIVRLRQIIEKLHSPRSSITTVLGKTIIDLKDGVVRQRNQLVHFTQPLKIIVILNALKSILIRNDVLTNKDGM